MIASAGLPSRKGSCTTWSGDCRAPRDRARATPRGRRGHARPQPPASVGHGSRAALPAQSAQCPVCAKGHLQIRYVENKPLPARQRAQVIETQGILPSKQCGTHRRVSSHDGKKHQRLLNTHAGKERLEIAGILPTEQAPSSAWSAPAIHAKILVPTTVTPSCPALEPVLKLIPLSKTYLNNGTLTILKSLEIRVGHLRYTQRIRQLSVLLHILQV